MSWPLVKLDFIKSPIRYSFVGGPFGSNLTTRDYTETGIPVIRGVNLPDSSNFLDDDFVFVSDRKADQLLPNNAHPGDIIFTQRGTLGQVGLIPQEAKYSRYVISQSQMKLTVDSNKAFAPFVYYFFRLHATVEKIKAHTITSGVPHINLGMLKGFELPLPPVGTQRRIATIISVYDEMIAANHRRIQLLEESARLLYREWFVKLRFPGHETVPVKDEVPVGWRYCNLSEAADINPSAISVKDHPQVIRYVDISSVETGQIGDVEEISFDEAPGRARRRVHHGDIIWSCVRPNRRSYALIWEPADNLIVSTGFAVLSARSILFSYLYLACTTDDFVSYLTNQATGAAYPAVSAKDFEKASILLPDSETLAAFDKIVLPQLEQIATIRSQNKQLRQARDLLLPKLMSGALDVSRITVPQEAVA